jgi:ATP-dependent DNA helicase RecG
MKVPSESWERQIVKWADQGPVRGDAGATGLLEDDGLGAMPFLGTWLSMRNCSVRNMPLQNSSSPGPSVDWALRVCNLAGVETFRSRQKGSGKLALEPSRVSIDLEHLARRENEQTEWKENVADIDDVVRTLCAFANDLSNLGGGYVVCGAAEDKDTHGFPYLRRSGLSAQRFKEVEGMVLTRCRERVFPAITPLVEELPADTADRRILIFVQAATQQSHQFREAHSTGKHYIRVSRQTLEARNGQLRELLVRKGDLEPWDRRPCTAATQADIDLVALRDTLARMGVQGDVAEYLSDTRQISSFVPPLCALEPLTKILRPRNFALLLFGRNVTRFIPGAVAIFSSYAGFERSASSSERHEISGNLLEQANQLSQLLDLQTGQMIDKSDLSEPNVFKYPKRALYEASGNALAHRDYEQADPTRITVFSDRIEFHSPGSLPLGLELDQLRSGQVGPKWRNQALAWFFNRLQLAQAEGQGIPTILKVMSDSGSPPPRFEADEVHVTCVLFAHQRARRSQELEQAEQALRLAETRLNRARGESLLEQNPLDEQGWKFWLQSGPDSAEVAKRVQQLGDACGNLSPLQLLAIGGALRWGEPQERDLGEKLIDQVRPTFVNFQILKSLLLKLMENGDAFLAAELFSAHPDYADEVLQRLLTVNLNLEMTNRLGKIFELARERSKPGWKRDPLRLLRVLIRRGNELPGLDPELIHSAQELISTLEETPEPHRNLP